MRRLLREGLLLLGSVVELDNPRAMKLRRGDSAIGTLRIGGTLRIDDIDFPDRL
jgi:hypothetical protein